MFPNSLHNVLRLTAILCATLLSACHRPGDRVDALPFRDGGQWGLAGTDGQVLCDTGLLPAQPSAAVNGMFSLPDSNGQFRLYDLSSPTLPASPRTFFRIGHFLEHDVAPAQESEGAPVIFIDRKGNTVASSAQYPHLSIRLVHNFSNGRALFRTNSGKWGYFDTEGRVAIPPLYDQAYDFSEGLALTGQNDAEGNTGYSIIDRRGNVVGTVIQPGCLLDTRFSNGMLMFNELATGSTGYINKEGIIIKWLSKEAADTLHTEHRAATCRTADGKFRLNSHDGQPVGEPHDTIADDPTAYGILPQVFLCGESTDKETPQAGAPHNRRATDSRPTPPAKDTERTPQAVTAPEDTDWKTVPRQNPFYHEAAKVLSGKLSEDDAHNRHMILNYVEHLRTSYTTKDIDFLRQLFSEKALIIVGKVIRTSALAENGYMPPARVIYNIKSKQQYLERLEAVFKANRKIDVRFSDFRIMRHPTLPGIYGVTLRQGYRSDLYSDDGYLFLLWDFRDKTAPKIHVRTWQPATTDGHTPLPADSVFGISDFNLE